MAEEEKDPEENIVEPIAALLKSDDDAERIEGAGKLKELAADPKCVTPTRFFSPFLPSLPSLGLQNRNNVKKTLTQFCR